MSLWDKAILIVFAVMTVVGFAIMLIDKRRAINGKWRVRESVLFLVALAFGGVGATIGMFACRHKTRHLSFRIGLPLLAIVNIALVVTGCIFL
ncbi:MAG: DUF1294 domain-containing protein [Clostridia bacterium]